jgi:putative transposase
MDGSATRGGVPLAECPAILLRDRDAVYGGTFSSRVQTMGSMKSRRRLGRLGRPYVERLIGTLRRECPDHVVVLNETHLRCLLSGNLIYYHGARTHLFLAKDAREPRQVERLDQGGVVETPMVGGLHDRYGERRKLLSAGRSVYIDGAGRCVRLGALEPTPQ